MEREIVSGYKKGIIRQNENGGYYIETDSYIRALPLNKGDKFYVTFPALQIAHEFIWNGKVEKDESENIIAYHHETGFININHIFLRSRCIRDILENQWAKITNDNLVNTEQKFSLLDLKKYKETGKLECKVLFPDLTVFNLSLDIISKIFQLAKEHYVERLFIENLIELEQKEHLIR